MATLFLRQAKNHAKYYLNDPVALRVEKEKFFGQLPCAKSVQQQPLQWDNITGIRFLPKKTRYAYKVVLYLHGGGYTCGSAQTHRSLVSKLAQETGIPNIAINYRLAPEYPYPAALDDALLAYRCLLDKERYHPKDIVVMGDSAGGGLALALLLKLKSLALPQPLTAVVLSPWTDLKMEGASAAPEVERDPILDVETAHEWAALYAGQTALDDPFVSPIYGDLSDLPPVLVQVGTEEILYNDATRFATFASMQQSEVTLQIEKNMPHVWHFFWPYLPEARTAIKNIRIYIDKKISEEETVNHWNSLEQLQPKGMANKALFWWRLSLETAQIGKRLLFSRR